MRRSRVNLLAVAVSAAAVLILGAQASAEPGQPHGSPSVEPSPNLLVDAVADEMTSHWQARGFGKVDVDYDSSQVLVYWQGPPPSGVVDQLGKHADGVNVVLKAAKFSAYQFDRAASALLKSEAGLGPNRTIRGVAPNAALTGLTVQLAESQTVAASERVASLESISGMPVDVQSVGEVVNLTRQNDSAPWQGGGALADVTGDDYCSNGFAVIRGGIGFLLSAHHCFANGLGQVVRDGVGDRIGTVADLARNRDAALIDPDASPATIGKVFGGPWNAGTGHTRYQMFVAAAAGPSGGQQICTSGARTGEHCNLTVRSTGKHFPCGLNLNGDCIGFEVWAPNGQVAVGAGDSGGPLYANRSDGRVTARGIVSNTTDTTPVACGSTAEPTTCYDWFNASGIGHILTTLGASIEVE